MTALFCIAQRLAFQHDFLAVEFILALAERHARGARICPDAGECARTGARGLAVDAPLKIKNFDARRLSLGAGEEPGDGLAGLDALGHSNDPE